MMRRKAETKPPTLAEAANRLVAILSAIVQMSDEVKSAAPGLDAQSKLLRMQNSIQASAARIVPHVQTVIHILAAERAPSNQPTEENPSAI